MSSAVEQEQNSSLDDTIEPVEQYPSPADDFVVQAVEPGSPAHIDAQLIDKDVSAQDSYVPENENHANTFGNALPLTTQPASSVVGDVEPVVIDTPSVDEPVANSVDGTGPVNAEVEKNTDCGDVPVPIYTISSDDDQLSDASDVEIVQEHRRCPTVSDHVRLSMDRLHVENVAVCIPKFACHEPPIPDELAVLSTMRQILDKAVNRRKNSASPLTRRGCILLVARSAQRVLRVFDFVQQNSTMKTSKYEGKPAGRASDTPQESETRPSPVSSANPSLQQLLMCNDVVVARDKDTLDHASRGLLHLQNVFLLVIDGAECATKRSHWTSMFMRDHYRALAEKLRPRVLAIARIELMPSRCAPIEHNVMAKFSSSLTSIPVWKSCRGKGSRPPELELLDVEYLDFKMDGNEMTYEYGRRTAVPRATERRGYSPIDSVVDEVGSLGVALSQYRFSVKERMIPVKGSRRPSSSGMHIHIGHEHATLGLTQKMMSLLNEIYEAYKASTELDSLMAIVHAGKPVVACAMCDVIRSMPVFESLAVSVALGKSQQDVGGSSSLHDLATDDWQGAETDDDEVSNFTCGETNVLIVAESYTARQKLSRPLPASPLVIRFDGTEANPEVDGGGGRCRVIVFRDRTKRGNPIDIRSTTNKPKNATSEDVVEAKNNTVEAKETVVNEPDEDEVCIVREVKAPCDTAVASGSNRPPIRREYENKDERRSQEQSATHEHFCHPAEALLGPSNDDGSPARAFLYRPLVFGESPSKLFSLSEVCQIGVESFLIALSTRLCEQDLIFPFKEYSNGTGNGSKVKGFVKLQYQGPLTISDERLVQARNFNSRLFSLIDNSFNPDQFSWGNPSSHEKASNDPAHNSFLRRYFVLPAKSCDAKQESVLEMSSIDAVDVEREDVDNERKRVFAEYFEESCNGKADTVLPNTMVVDWDSVESVLKLCSREEHKEQYQPKTTTAEESLKDFEGQLLFSSMPHETLILSGRLRYGFSPLTLVSRSRKFPLNKNGTLKPHNDLAHLANIVTCEESINAQERETGVSSQNGVSSRDPEVIDVDVAEEDPAVREEKADQSKTFPAQWSHEKQALVRCDDLEIKGKSYLFNCHRNVLKKRDMWVGVVRYRVEQYFSRFYNKPISMLSQPLLKAARPRRVKFDELLQVLHGESVEDVFDTIAESGVDARMVVPELSQIYPISRGAIFLPSILMHMEQHVSICELRAKFDKYVGVIGELSQVVRAVTPAYINTSTNYERLEFLGDSLFKLSCTIRLFVKFTHEDEGYMTYQRARILSNHELHRRANKLGLYNYTRFENFYEDDWKPPGTDTRAVCRRFQMKSLADIVEALCGAYFIVGTRRRGKGSKKARTTPASTFVERSDSAESDDSDVEWVYTSDDDEGKGTEQKASENGNGGGQLSRKRKRRSSVDEDERPHFSASSVERGYVAGYKFLEKCGAVYANEPSHRDVLLSAIFSMLPRDSPRPKEVTLQVLPPDHRVSVANKVWEENYGSLEKLIGYKFKRRHLLTCALTHSSYIKPVGPVGPSETYERLEFLGDAVADFFVVCYLYERFPELGPGELTTLKGNVVSNESFARVSMAFGLHKYLCSTSATVSADIEIFEKSLTADLTQGGKGGHSSLKRNLGELAAPKALGDLFEAIIGAVFVDSGLKQAWRVCMRLLDDCLRINADPERGDLHPCDELIDIVGRVWKLGKPEFREEWAKGRKYAATVYILGQKITTGVGSTRRRARLVAARDALKLLQDEDAESEGSRLLHRLREISLRRRARVY